MTAVLPAGPPFGPDQHKAMASQLGLRRVEELLVLSRQNDPFFKGTPAHWRDARWFAGLWEHFGFDRGVHLRRVHYRAMTDGYPKLDGTPYANTEPDWSYLTGAGTAARILGLIDPEAFVDRRNTPPIRNVHPREEPAIPELLWDVPAERYLVEIVDRLGWDVPSLDPDVLRWSATYRLPAPSVRGYDYEADDQSTLLEVWIEKSTMNDVLVPVCQGLRVNLLAGTGFQSITAAIQLLRRAEQHGKPAHVFYISDFDPAGVVMPVAIARQAQFWAARLGIDAELTLEPIVLTREQVDAYQLPRVPVRLDKHGRPDKRGKGFEVVYGEGVVELDALEALHPGQLAELVRHAVRPYLDRDLAGRLESARREGQVAADTARHEATSDLRVELAEVEEQIRGVVESYRERLQGLADELAADLAPHQQTLDELAERTRRAADGFEVDLPARPLAATPEVDRTRLLYDSTRDWSAQLRAFKQAAGQQQDGGS